MHAELKWSWPTIDPVESSLPHSPWAHMQPGHHEGEHVFLLVMTVLSFFIFSSYFQP